MTVCASPSPKLGDTRRSPTSRATLMWCGCVDCGKERWEPLDQGDPVYKRCKSCAAKQSHKVRDRGYYKRGSEHYAWKGGRSKTHEGYIYLWLPRGHPYIAMATKGTRVLEHRLFVAMSVGRCLESWEIVHHINGIRDDNRLENLELMPNRSSHTPDTYAKAKIGTLKKQVERLRAKLKEPCRYCGK